LIKRELSQKGVADTTIDEAVSRVLDDPEEQDEEGRGLEERNALELARRRARSFAGEDWPGFYRKLGNFLARRGFDYSIVKNTVRQVWRELKDETPEEEAE
jgi:regulatory protein